MAEATWQGLGPGLLAISDLHVEVPENRRFVDTLRPGHESDWLIVCGDVGELLAEVERKVIWVPGNHELWTRPDDPSQLRGEHRYVHLVEFCQRLGVVTPEDDFPVWDGAGIPLVLAPLFTLYDYTFGFNIGATKRESLARAKAAGVICSDEYLLFCELFGTIEDWCAERVRTTTERLERATAKGQRSLLINHFPLTPELTEPLFHPEFAQWCGTIKTADWHRRFNALAVVYGHLHIPRTTVHDGVPFVEVSLGYPRQWMRRGTAPAPHRVLPEIVRA
jgi:hypothetical protein